MSKIQPEYLALMNRIARALDQAFAPAGFALLVFDLDKPEAGNMNWISNAQRSDMIAALKEMTAQLEGRVGKAGRV